MSRLAALAALTALTQPACWTWVTTDDRIVRLPDPTPSASCPDGIVMAPERVVTERAEAGPAGWLAGAGTVVAGIGAGAELEAGNPHDARVLGAMAGISLLLALMALPPGRTHRRVHVEPVDDPNVRPVCVGTAAAALTESPR